MQVVGENAIIDIEKDKIKVTKVPLDCRWYERLLFGNGVRFNKDLARRIPDFFDYSVYVPRMFGQEADELQLLQDGGRSCINPDKHITLDLFGVNQTYVEKRKGVGASYNKTYPYDRFYNEYKTALRDRLKDEELKKYLEDNDLLLLDIDHGFDRPYGAQREGFALNELEMSKALERLSIKHTPVLTVFPFPKDVEEKARKLTDKYFGCGNRPKKERYYQEVLLFPGNVRTSTDFLYTHSNSQAFFKTLENMKVDLNKFTKDLERDFLHFMEMTPKTLTEAGDEYIFLGFGNWLFSDCLVAPTGLYVSDLESVGLRKIKKSDFISDWRPSIYYFGEFWRVIRIANSYLFGRNSDEMVEGLVSAFNTSKYFDVDLEKKKGGYGLDHYVLKIRMECESGIRIDFEKGIRTLGS